MEENKQLAKLLEQSKEKARTQELTIVRLQKQLKEAETLLVRETDPLG